MNDRNLNDHFAVFPNERHVRGFSLLDHVEERRNQVGNETEQFTSPA
jgi:hypothetical protein